MSENLILALQITVIGMSLVFAAILVLWGLMALIVRFAADRKAGGDEISLISTGDIKEESISEPDLALKRLAAAAAVTAALARQAASTEPHPFPLPPTPIVSAWQAVLRTRMLTKRGFRR